MDNQNAAFTSAYGEAMFYAHVIEDLVALHLYECSWFHVNGYSGLTRRQIRKLSHEKRIDELRKIYHKKGNRAIEQLLSALPLLSKIRNKLTHAFIPQVGSELRSEEGIDQVNAMLQNIIRWESFHLRTLKRTH